MAFDGDGGAAGAGGDAAGGSAADILGGAAAGGSGEGGAAGAGGGEGGAGEVDPDWWTGISGEADGEKASHRDWLKTSGIRDLDGLVKVARDNQAALRESGRIKVPGEGAKPEEIAEFQRAIGVPEAVDGYVITAPKDADGQDIRLDTDLIGKLSASALKHGAPKGAFEGLVHDFMAIQIEQRDAEMLEQQRIANETITAWGPQKDAKLAAADAAIKALGLNRDQLVAMRSALGADVLLEKMAQVGGGMAEDVLITGGQGRFGMSAADAQAKMDEMKAAPGMLAKLQNPKSQEAKDWARYNAIVAEDQARKRDGR